MKIKMNKKILCGLVAATIGFTGFSLIKSNVEKNEKIENEIGHSDFSLITSWNLSDKDFVVLNAGDHDSVETHFQGAKMKYCNKNDISLGVIISSSANNEASIYDDVEYVKGIISEYNVDFPVYLNINEIITNDDLNIEMKTKIIKNFLEKCSSNNIYVGIYGTDTNLCRVREFCDIKDYDAYLVMDKDEITYDGTYNVVEDLDGNIKALVNLGEVIVNKGFNSSDKFVSDGTYVVSGDEDIVDIALKYGLSVNELLEFNDLSKKDVKEGTKLRIPSIIANKIPIIVDDFEVLDTPIKGCDLSYSQGKNIDWDKLNENFDYIILKCSEGLSLDSCFEDNAKNCSLNGIPMGVYCYNAYNKLNCDDMDTFIKKQKQQADFVLSALKNKNIDYPVYFDIEAPNGKTLDSRLTKEQVNVMLDIWCDKMESSGYIPGLYCNQSGFKFLQSCVDYPLYEKLQVWIAGGDQYGRGEVDVNNVVPSKVLDNEIYGATAAQSTDSAINCGAGNSQGHLDVNYCLVDYSKSREVIEVETNDVYEIKEFDRPDIDLIMPTTIALLGGALIGVTLKKKGKVKQK